MKQVHILLVEDNAGDIILTKEAFEESKIGTRISVAKNGEEALNFLFQRNGFENVDMPDLILLDINIPIINGHEVLKELKQSDFLKKIPIIILSTSANDKDINKAYKNYANSYVVKPIEIQDFLNAVLKIEEFWLQLSVLSK